MTPNDDEREGQGAIGGLAGNDASGAQSSEQRRQRQRDLDAHDRIVSARAAEAARDTLHDSTPLNEPGAYTIYEARDRAAHTPSIAGDIDRPDPRAKSPKSIFTGDERYLLDVQRRKDMAELYPDGPEARWLQERARLANVSPDGPEARQIAEETKQAVLYADTPQTGRWQDLNNRKENSDVTPEQQANVDKALAETQLSNKIGGATDVSSHPAPNEPTPLDKSRDIGQDLHHQGVTMDKDK